MTPCMPANLAMARSPVAALACALTLHLALFTGIAPAQNPLRAGGGTADGGIGAGPGQDGRAGSSQVIQAGWTVAPAAGFSASANVPFTGMPAAVRYGIPEPDIETQPGRPPSAVWQAPTGAEPTRAIQASRNAADVAERAVGEATAVAGSGRSGRTPASQPFSGPASLEVTGTVRQLAIATSVSLVGCAVFLLAARVVQRRREQIPVARAEPAARVEQTLSLGNKSVLRLVRVGQQQVLVATDAGGIRSVLPVTTDFAALVDDGEDEPPPTPEQQLLLEQLLARSATRKGKRTG